MPILVWFNAPDPTTVHCVYVQTSQVAVMEFNHCFWDTNSFQAAGHNKNALGTWNVPQDLFILLWSIVGFCVTSLSSLDDSRVHASFDTRLLASNRSVTPSWHKLTYPIDRLAFFLDHLALMVFDWLFWVDSETNATRVPLQCFVVQVALKAKQGPVNRESRGSLSWFWWRNALYVLQAMKLFSKSFNFTCSLM